MNFYVKMKIREIISNDFGLDKCYPERHNPERHSRGFNRHILNNANAGIVTFKHHNSKSTQ